MNITLSVDIYCSVQCKVIHTRSDLHVLWHPLNSKDYLTPVHDFKKISLAFSIEN